MAIHDDVQLVGEPHRVLEALRMLVGQVDVACGLSSTGHKFGIFARPSVVDTDSHGAVSASAGAVRGGL